MGGKSRRTPPALVDNSSAHRADTSDGRVVPEFGEAQFDLGADAVAVAVLGPVGGLRAQGVAEVGDVPTEAVLLDVDRGHEPTPARWASDRRVAEGGRKVGGWVVAPAADPCCSDVPDLFGEFGPSSQKCVELVAVGQAREVVLESGETVGDGGFPLARRIELGTRPVDGVLAVGGVAAWCAVRRGGGSGRLPCRRAWPAARAVDRGGSAAGSARACRWRPASLRRASTAPRAARPRG